MTDEDKKLNQKMYVKLLMSNLDDPCLADDEGKEVVYNSCLANFLFDAVDEFMSAIPKEVREDVIRLASNGQIYGSDKLGHYITTDFFDSNGLPTS